MEFFGSFFWGRVDMVDRNFKKVEADQSFGYNRGTALRDSTLGRTPSGVLDVAA